MNLLKNCWQRRWIRGLVWTSVSIGTGYGLLCAWVNWSGARQLNATLAMVKAEGETLDFRAIVPEPVPDAENFCAIPLLKDLALVVDNDVNKGVPGEKRKRLEELKLPENRRGGTPLERPALPRAGLGQPIALNTWADWLREERPNQETADSGNAARQVLAALAKHDPIVQELVGGLGRPHARWTPEWKTRELPKLLFNIPLPHYPSENNMTKALSLRAVAAARAGDGSRAHEAVRIFTRLNEATWNEPFAIGALVASAGTFSLCGVTWELCRVGAGTAGDFRELETALARIDIRRSGLQMFRSEIAGSFNYTQQLLLQSESRREVFRILSPVSTDSDRTFTKILELLSPAIPAGFFEANTSVFLDRQIRHLLLPLRDQGWLAVIQGVKEMSNEILGIQGHLWRRPTLFFANISLPVITRVVWSMAHTEALTAQAAIACALERHRIEKGEYPETLGSLTLADGRPLPNDVMTGQPMRYRREANGRYTLWSVGFDGKDDGGKRNLDPKNAEATRFHNPDYIGDWVWNFPAK